MPLGAGDKDLRRRKAPVPNEKSNGNTHREMTEVTVETLHCVQTDTSPDTLQKAVCFSDDHTLMATGGVDGFLRVWEVHLYGEMKKWPVVLLGSKVLVWSYNGGERKRKTFGLQSTSFVH